MYSRSAKTWCISSPASCTVSHVISSSIVFSCVFGSPGFVYVPSINIFKLVLSSSVPFLANSFSAHHFHFVLHVHVCLRINPEQHVQPLCSQRAFAKADGRCHKVKTWTTGSVVYHRNHWHRHSHHRILLDHCCTQHRAQQGPTEAQHHLNQLHHFQ